MIDRRLFIGLALGIAPAKGQEKAKLIALGPGITSPQLSIVPGAPKREVSLQGWLLLNGAEASRTEYRELFEALGSNAGQGDGVTTFSLPVAPFEMMAGRPVRGYAICPKPRLGLVGSFMPFNADTNL